MFRRTFAIKSCSSAVVTNMALARFLSFLLLGMIAASSASSYNCDQSFTASTGEISSPNFPSHPSQQRLVCKYRIKASAGQRIQLYFLPHPQVTDNFGCYYGSLRVFEHVNPDLVLDTPSAYYCRSIEASHKAYLSNGSTLVLVYASKSGYYYYYFKFKLQYRMISGNNMVYNYNEGLLYSPNFMNKLLNRSQVYTYRIEANPGMIFYLFFSYINFHDDMNCSTTSLLIYEGANSNGIPAGQRCGTNSTEFISISNVITLNYTISGNTSLLPADHGFIIYYASGSHGCNKFYTSSSGIIYSPLHPNRYPNNTICTYNIIVQKGYMIYFKYRSIYLSAGDTLELLDPAIGNVMQRGWSSWLSNSYYSTSNTLLIKFKSNEIHNYYGFTLEYFATKGCNITFTQSTYITSPLFPVNYPNNMVCNYTFNFIQYYYYYNTIYIYWSDIENSRACKNDSLSIYDGSSTQTLLLDRRCGAKNMRSYMTSGNSLFMQFKANKYSSRQGFRARYYLQAVACGGSFSSSYDKYTIQSPGFPEPYTNDSICRYQLYGRVPGFGMRLQLQVFDLEDSKGCYNDNVTIYNGQIRTSAIEAIKCGHASGDLFFQSRYLIAVFRSNSHLASKGFSINVEACSKLFTNETGTVTSPGYAASTPSYALFCTYAIRLQEGARVQLVFQNFSLGSYHYNSYLNVYDGRNSSVPLVATMRLSNYQNILASGNELFMEISSWYCSSCKFKLEYFNNQGYCLNQTPCKNNATCTELHKDYRCTCSINYAGRNCSEKINPCKSNPSLNDGVRTNIYSDQPPTYRCTCLDEYIGKICQYLIDPCLSYSADSTWQRSNQSIFNPKSMSPLCDSSLSTTWYRFVSKAGGRMPLSCPPVNSCGTSNSIWANGSLPSSVGKYRTLKACVRNKDSCCSERWPIRVRKCSLNGTEFLLYKLPPSPRCPMAYCAGSKIPCPDGFSSPTGFTPCNDKVPRLKSNPRVIASHESGRVLLACKYDIDTNTDQMNIEVTWYQGDSAKAIHKENVQWWQRQATLQNKKNSKPIFRLGVTIYCKVRGWYGTYQGIASRYYESNHFYAGLQISPRVVYERITEGGPPLKINLTSTVPVVCSGKDECKVQVQLVHDTSEIFLTSCSVTFKKGISFHTIDIYAKRDFIDDGNKVVTIKISIVDGSNAVDWRNHIELNDIKVEVIDIGTARCSSNGDPRLLTFDKLHYGHFQPGDHVLVKSLSRSFEVHARTWKCGSVTCNCGIAVREGDDVIILDMCWDGIPRLRFASKKVPVEGTVVRRDPTGKSIIIKFPSGAYVRSDYFFSIDGGFANFIVQVPSDDFGLTRGLCGTFDNNFNNDMLGKDGRSYDHLSYLSYTAPLEFTESWKIPVRQSLFYHRKAKTGCPKKEKKIYCDCKGEPQKKSGVKCAMHEKISQPPEFKEIGWKEIRYGGSNCKKRMRRSMEDAIILPEDDDVVDYTYDPKPLPNVTIDWPTKSGKTEVQVTNYCNKTIKDSAPGKICAKIPGFNFTSFLLQRIDDIKITDNYEFSTAAVRAMQDVCEEIFLKNTSYWEKDPANNGSLVPPIEMAGTLCPSLCSGHGKCEKGKCICDSNYTSADCSINKMKGPTVVSIPGNGTCDARNRSDCHLTRVTGRDFIDSGTLSCRVLKVMKGSKQSKSEKIRRSYLLSFLEVICDLGQHPVNIIGDPYKSKSFTHAIYELQISNDKKVYSKDKAPYIIYDSKCMRCNANTVECTQKPSTCIINGYCFDNGEKYASDPCFVCKPSASGTTFTSSCKASNKAAKSNLALIVSTSVAAVVVIALTIILVRVHVARKRGKIKIQRKKQAKMTKASFENQAYTCQ